MTARVIALDLDGTLLTPQKTCSPRQSKRCHAPERQATNLSSSPGVITSQFILFIRHWRWIHLQFAVMAPICMIITQKTFS